MTPELYMKRYHGRDCDCDTCDTCDLSDGCGASCPLTAEEVYPCASTPTEPSPTSDGCCCKGSMADALRLLCGETLGSLVDFDAFFFLTDSLAVGSPLSLPRTDTDNITTPTASLRRFSPCNCDLLEVSGTAYFADPGTGTGLVALEEIDQLSLCALKAVAFQIETSDCDDECEDTNYRRAVRAIRRAIRAEGGSTGACGVCQAHCDCDDCCCASGILNELSTRNLSRQATLTAGPLVLQNVAVLGSIGSALVLADEDLSRIYLVCANAVEALA